ncbi:MAG: hypothetical protein E6H49_17315 [Betaproteobacteria bacterium]|nr:MAG: hypothetical protein E6H49_17315 [Betaproteobacteria bacterium]
MISVRTTALALACLIWAGGAHAQGKWTKLAAFPEPAEELLGASAGGKMYVFCGLAPGWKPIGMVYEYDPAGDKWTKKKPMPLASHHVSFTEYKGKIYAFGGFVLPQSGPAAWVPIDNAWEYDPATDNWKALAPLATKRGSPVAVTVADKIYATAGVVNGKVYVIGGRVGGAFVSSGSSNVGIVEEYDPATDTWGAPRARMPSARSAMSSGTWGGKIYVTGGEGQDYVNMYAFRALEAYDPGTNTWTVLPNMPVGRHGLAGAVVGNRLHMVSGDVQSAGTGVPVHTESHDAYDLK